jgi:hypothetical protein
MDEESNSGGKKIDPAGTNPLLCRVLAQVNRRHAERCRDIGQRLDALEVARLWDAEADRQEQGDP